MKTSRDPLARFPSAGTTVRTLGAVTPAGEAAAEDVACCSAGESPVGWAGSGTSMSATATAVESKSADWAEESLFPVVSSDKANFHFLGRPGGFEGCELLQCCERETMYERKKAKLGR